MDYTKFYQIFVTLLGSDRVLSKRSQLEEYSTGSSVHIFGLTDKWHYLHPNLKENYWPDLVVLPETTKHVSSILKLANKERIPVIAWGGGSNTHGCTLPISGGIVIDLRKMDKIIEIEKETPSVTSQSGISLLELQQELMDEGYCHGSNPGSAPWATLGGSLCCEAHTLAGFKYGATLDNLIGLEAVMPNGEIIKTKSRYSGGYNLNNLFARSEGTLGIVTEIKMRVHPLPEFTTNIGFAFDAFKDAVETHNAILKKRFSTLGVMLAFDEKSQIYRNKNEKNIILMTLEGYQDIVKIEQQYITRIASERGGNNLPEETADVVQDWWTMLVGMSYESAEKQITAKIGPHVWIPINKIYEAYKIYKKLASKHRLSYAGAMCTPTRLSIGVKVDRQSIDEKKRYGSLTREYSAYLIKNGGSIMGAHGCGLAFKNELKAEYEEGFHLMEKIKKAIDPKGIMNPGKIF